MVNKKMFIIVLLIVIKLLLVFVIGYDKLDFFS